MCNSSLLVEAFELANLKLPLIILFHSLPSLRLSRPLTSLWWSWPSPRQRRASPRRWRWTSMTPASAAMGRGVNPGPKSPSVTTAAAPARWATSEKSQLSSWPAHYPVLHISFSHGYNICVQKVSNKIQLLSNTTGPSGWHWCSLRKNHQRFTTDENLVARMCVWECWRLHLWTNGPKQHSWALFKS